MQDKIKLSCFLIRVQNQKGETIDRGTGFFINQDGYFLSAGHVFKRTGYQYIAEIDGDFFPIHEIFKEYVEQDQYTDNLYHDLFIGKLDYVPKASLELSTNVPKPGDAVQLSGYNRKQLEESTYDSYITALDVGGIVKVNITIDNFYIIRNAFRIKEMDARIAGLSGGPVTIGKDCYGILSTTAECLAITYVTEKLNGFKIPYSTH